MQADVTLHSLISQTFVGVGGLGGTVSFADDGQVRKHALEAGDNCHRIGVAVHQIFFKSLGNGQGLGGEVHLVASVLVVSHDRNSFLFLSDCLD